MRPIGCNGEFTVGGKRNTKLGYCVRNVGFLGILPSYLERSGVVSIVILAFEVIM